MMQKVLAQAMIRFASTKSETKKGGNAPGYEGLIYKLGCVLRAGRGHVVWRKDQQVHIVLLHKCLFCQLLSISLVVEREVST